MSQLLLSICIPTMNRALYLDKTLSKLNEAYRKSKDFEVVISDNSDDDLTEKLCHNYSLKGLNVKYYKNPIKGFHNSIKALTLGEGAFLKLHNDYSVLDSKSVFQIIGLAKDTIMDKPIFSFTNSRKKDTIDYKFLSLKDYIFKLGHVSTWSSSFSCWHEDLNDYRDDYASIQKLTPEFPHTNLLYNILKDRKCAIIDNNLWNDLHIEGKSGYSIFRIFVSVHLAEFREFYISRPEIWSPLRYQFYRYKLLIMFLSRWYALTNISKIHLHKFNFDNSNNYEHFRSEYSMMSWVLMKSIAFVYSAYYCIIHYLQKVRRS